MDKIVRFDSSDELGQHFSERIDLTPRGGGLQKIAGRRHPEIEQYIKALRPDPKYQWVLMTPMGDFETWGINCLPAGTPIRLSSGEEVPVEEIEVGDEVETHEARYRKVTKLFSGEASKLIRIRPQGSAAALETTPGHPYFALLREDVVRLKRKYYWKGKDREGFLLALEPDWVEASDLREGDYVCLPIEQAVEVHDELQGEDTAFILGLYTAEGCIARRRWKDRTGEPWQDHLVIWTLGGHEGEKADKLVSCLERRGLSVSRTDQYQGNNAIRVSVVSQKLARICRDHVGKLPLNKFLSPAVMRMPQEWQRSFLRAYVGGDGHLVPGGKSKGTMRISTASPRLADGVRLLIARLGMVSTVVWGHQHHTSLGAGNPIYEVTVPTSQWVGGVVQKTESFILGNFLVCPVKERTEIDWHGMVYNFEVEEDNSYVAGGIVLHNSNGDVFPHCSLSFDYHKGNPAPVIAELVRKYLAPFGQELPIGDYQRFGYRTFVGANRFLHHINKDPSISYGIVELSAWNPVMRRVEVIVRHDREAAKRVGAEQVIADIDENRPRSISMGCRVPFDVCTVCGHISRTQSDYCEHLRAMMGRTLGNGKIVGAVNFFPNFFDLSDVVVPAAKESGVLMKVAQQRGSAPGEFQKRAAYKLADIDKEVDPNTEHPINLRLRRVIDREPQLPLETLRRFPLSSVLNTTAALGMVLRPEEFQDSMLCSLRRPDIANVLMRQRRVFRSDCCDAPGGPLDPGSVHALLAELLGRSGIIRERSAFAPWLPGRIRILAIIQRPAAAPFSEVEENTPLLSKIASLYNSYRESLRYLPQFMSPVLEKHAALYHTHFFEPAFDNPLVKVAETSDEKYLPPALVPMYLYSAYRGEVRDPIGWEVPSSWSPLQALWGA